MDRAPQATDFTTIEEKDGEFLVLVRDAHAVVVSKTASRKEAEEAELAINQIMVAYKIKRDAWEARQNRADRDRWAERSFNELLRIAGR